MKALLFLALLIAPCAIAPEATSAQPASPCALQIGDSLTVGAAPYLAVWHVHANGAVGRQWVTGVAVARSLRHRGLLPARVVVELGTNGSVSSPWFWAMVHAIGPRRIVFVTPYGNRPWIPSTVSVIVRNAQRGHFGLVRWDQIAPRRLGYLEPDGIHLTVGGYPFYAYLSAHAAGCAK